MTPRPVQRFSSSVLVSVLAVATSAFSPACATSGARTHASGATIAASESDPSDSTAASSSAPTARARPRGAPLSRADIEHVVSRGLGAFLARLQVTPVVEGSRFVGFRLDAADDLEEWHASGSDIRVGDVLRRVNGMSVERPEQAMWAFNNLRTVSVLELLVRRNGADVTIRQPIVDTPRGS